MIFVSARQYWNYCGNIMHTIINKVCLLLDSRGSGGIESHVHMLAEGLSEQGIKVEVLLLKDYGGHAMMDQLLGAGFACSMNNNGARGLFRRLREIRPSILHTHGYKSGILGRLVGRLLGIRVVNTYHAGEAAAGKMRLYDLIDRWSGVFNHRSIAVSEKIAARLPFRARVLKNFVRLPEQLSSGNEIAFVGRLSHEKGPDYVLQMARRFPHRTFQLYGDGPMRASLQQQAPDNVRFMGNQSDMSQVWPRIGLLLMPSRHEGLPMAALEAMAHGIPVLASRVGDLHRLVESGNNGLLCAPGDIDAFCDGLQQVFDDDNTRQRLAGNARKTLEHSFSMATELPRLIGLYHEALR